MTDTQKPIANPYVVLREEFDEWAILFDPDTNKAFGLNPVSVFIWKHLDGRHTIADIAEQLRKDCQDVPEHAEKSVERFVNMLFEKGLAGREVPME